jgi:peptidyl-prolyl cis-trans isomerase D
MAVLETLRKKAGPLLVAVIGIALLSFVLGDMFGGSGGGLFSSQNVGKINGKKISYEDYNREVEYFSNIYRIMYNQDAGGEAITEEIQLQAWASLVRKYAVDVEYEKMGIAISGDELFELIQGDYPSPVILQNFTNPQTGELDRVGLLGYLQNLDFNPNPDAKTYWLFLEKEIINQRLQAKLLNLVGKSMYVTTLDAQESLGNTANSVDIDFVSKSLDSYPDSLISVTSGDVKKYYSQNKNRYKQNDSRTLEYVAFPIRPSVEDDAEALSYVQKLQKNFGTAKDVRQFVTLNSDVPFDPTYYKKGELPEKLDRFVFSAASQSEVLAPYLDDNSYKMVRLADVRMLPDSVRVRHILIDAKSIGLTAARKTADSLKTLLVRNRAKFEDLAKEYSIDQVANENGGDLGWFSQSMMVKPFEDSAFFAKKGAIVTVETQFGVHVMEVMDKGPAVKKVQLGIIEREVSPSRRTREQIFAQANDIASRAANVETFTALVGEKGLTKHLASNITINDRNIQGLQGARELVRWAYKAKVGNISPISEISDNFVVAVLTKIGEEGYTPVDEVKAEIVVELIREKKGQLISEEMKGVGSLQELADKLETTVKSDRNISFSTFYIPQIGIEPNLAAAASGSKRGEMSDPIRGNAGVYVFSVTAAKEGLSDAAAAVEKIRLQEGTLQRAMYEMTEALRVNADVKDERGKWLF